MFTRSARNSAKLPLKPDYPEKKRTMNNIGGTQCPGRKRKRPKNINK